MRKFFGNHQKEPVKKHDATEPEKTIRSSDENKTPTASDMIDDISFIREMKHIQGAWQQYDVLLAAGIYG